MMSGQYKIPRFTRNDSLSLVSDSIEKIYNKPLGIKSTYLQKNVEMLILKCKRF